MARAYPINSSASAVTTPGVNDYDLTRVPTELLTEGVLRGFTVTQRGAGANMSVDVAAGLALIEITNTNVSHGKTYKTWFEETLTTNKTIATADATNPRIDRVVLRIDVGDGTEGSADPNATASDIAIIEVLTGTPAASPSEPAVPDNALSRATITIPAGATSITDAMITLDDNDVDLDPDVLADVIRALDLASTASGKGASMIGVEDAGGHFTGSTVEEVFQEIGATPSGSRTVFCDPHAAVLPVLSPCAAMANVQFNASSIAVDAVSTGGATATSLTISHTCAGANRALLVGFWVNSSSDLATSVTYNGVALTRIGTVVQGAERAYLYILLAPDTGTHNIVISLSSSVLVRAANASYTGVLQWKGTEVSTTNTAASSTSLSISLTTTLDKDWLVMFARNNGGTYSAGAGTTIRQATSPADSCLADSNGGLTAGANSLTLSSPTGAHCGVGCALIPESTKVLSVLDFDQSSREEVEFSTIMPSNYAGGTVTARFHWTTSAATGNVVWGIQAVALSDTDAASTDMGSAQTVTDGSNGANAVNVSDDTPDLTIGGTPDSGKVVHFRVFRDAANASDTLAADARLLSVEITF